MRKSLQVLAAIALLVTGVALASAAPRDYLIVAKAQGRGSADLDDVVAAAGGVITAKIPEIGVVVASSDNPNFLKQVVRSARVQQAAEDIEVQWINNEQNIEAVESDLQVTGVNSEPYLGLPVEYPPDPRRSNGRRRRSGLGRRTRQGGCPRQRNCDYASRYRAQPQPGS